MPRLLLAALLLSLSTPVWGQKRKGYHKATEGQAVVLRKLFPQKNRIEVNANFGAIMNQSFIDTMILNGGISYHFSEEWGLALEGVMAINKDRAERTCIESFYNDFRGEIAEDNPLRIKCYRGDIGDQGQNISTHKGKINIGPAYMPITEIGNLFSLSAVWSPVYGKQIFSFLPRTSHMDIFLSIGGGIAMSSFYSLKEELKNGKKGRLTNDGTEDDPATNMAKYGATEEEENSWGEKGQPEPDQQTNPFIGLGVGQKYHFLKHLFIKVELRNFTLLATSQGYHNFFTMWGGLGLRL